MTAIRVSLSRIIVGDENFSSFLNGPETSDVSKGKNQRRGNLPLRELRYDFRETHDRKNEKQGYHLCHRKPQELEFTLK